MKIVNNNNLLSLIILFIFCIIAAGSLEDKNIKRTEEVRKMENVARVSAQEFYDLYNEELKNNEIAAEEKFKNKVVEISGKVDDIGKDFTDKLFLTLEIKKKSIISGMQFYFVDAEKEKLLKINKGDSVVIRAVCEEWTLGHISFKSCVIVQ